MNVGHGDMFRGYKAALDLWRLSACDAGLGIDHFPAQSGNGYLARRSHIDREARSWEKSSDHAPVWIELRDAKRDQDAP
jgi:exonuclease III